MKYVTKIAIGLVLALTPATAAMAADITIRLAHEAPPSSPKGVWADSFAEAVAEKSDGRIEVQVFPQGQLFNSPRTAIEAVVAGQLQVAIPSTGYLATIVPSFEVIDLPMLFENQEALYKFEDSSVAADMLSELDAKGMKGLGFASNVSLDLFSQDRIVELAEFKGKKIRAHSAMLEETVRALGGNPIAMPASELYLALQQGVVDGAFTTVTYAGPNNYNEVTTSVTRAAVSAIAYPVVANLVFWNGLDDADREAILDAVAVASAKNRAELDEVAGAAVDSLKTGGVTFVELTDDQRTEWRAKLSPIYDDFKARVSPTLLDSISSIN